MNPDDRLLEVGIEDDPTRPSDEELHEGSAPETRHYRPVEGKLWPVERGFEVDGIFFKAETPQDAFAQFLKTRAGARAKGRKVTIRPCELVKVPEATPPKKSEKA